MEEEETVKTVGYPAEKRVSAKYGKGTFAYITATERMPRILGKVVDSLNQLEVSIREKHKEEGVEELKTVIGKISELRYQMQTDKAMEPICLGPDVEQWNNVFAVYRKELGSEPTWFSVSWLFAECFMYRKIADIIRNSSLPKNLDHFAIQKNNSFKAILPQVTSMAVYVLSMLSKPQKDTQMEFQQLLLLCLWGNRQDLSMMASVDSYDATFSQMDSDLKSLRTNLLADHSNAVWELLKMISQPKPDQSTRRIDFVLDNVGLELVSDLSLAEWLLSARMADCIHLHFKQLPWFVSDALQSDLHWTLQFMISSDNTSLNQLANRWQDRIKNGSFVLKDHYFWTTSFEYAAMESVAPDLYSDLSQSYLVFFKGDLNYRKLLADRNWLYTETFSSALGGFEPTNICALRTLKADVVTGLPQGAADRAARENKDWMITGQYAVLQLHNTH